MKCANPKCEHEFEPHWRTPTHQKYCSTKCKDRHRSLLHPGRNSKKAKEWAKRNPDKIQEAKNRRNLKKREETRERQLKYTPTPGICKVCNHSFLMKKQNPYQTYCSKKCRKKVEYLRHKDGYIKTAYEKKRIYIHLADTEKHKTCECGETFMFTKNTFHQKFCSIKCQNKFLGRRTRANNLINVRQHAKKWAAKDRETLGDNYIKNRLIRSSKDSLIIRKDLPSALIETKRIQIKIQRLCKNQSTTFRI